MRSTHLLLFIQFFNLPCIHSNNEFYEFVGDIIVTWSMQSPVIVIDGEMEDEDFCLRNKWQHLCLTNHLGTTDLELAEPLTRLHESRPRGIIFLGKGHTRLLQELFNIASSMFTSESPVFMPREYLNATRLRLDSNILFYQHIEESGEYEVTDIFAVKGGEPRVLEMGKWNATNGFIFQNSINRWDRRIDLKGVTFENSLGESYQAKIIRNKNGTIVRTSGWFQDILFYVTDRINLKVMNREIPPTNKGWILLDNGSWTGGVGMLQRKEADICSDGVGVTYDRSMVINYPLPIIHKPCSLIAAMPRGTHINMWAFIKVRNCFKI